MKFVPPTMSTNLILAIAILLAVASAKANQEADLFSGLQDAEPPRIIRELDESIEGVPEGVRTRRVVFASSAGKDEAFPHGNEVYALIAFPKTSGTHPGVLILHGGKGVTEERRVLEWASKGFVALSLDIPGIADPEKATHSAGTWISKPYDSGRWTVNPTPESSVLFQAVTAAGEAFNLLDSLPETDSKKLGIHGISWGGYMTAMVSSIAADRVKAAFSVYGCGFYETCRYHEALDKLPPEERESWFRHFDAGRRAALITAPFFIAESSNDFAFWPPSVEKTLNAISGPTNVLYAPNANHKLPVPGGSTKDIWADMAIEYFNFHLKDEGENYPSSQWLVEEENPKKSVFQVTSQRPIQSVKLYYSLPTEDWRKREWKELSVKEIEKSIYETDLPVETIEGIACFALISDDRPVSVSSRMRFLSN